MTAVHASARRKGSGPWTQWHEAHVSVQPETRHDGAELVRLVLTGLGAGVEVVMSREAWMTLRGSEVQMSLAYGVERMKRRAG